MKIEDNSPSLGDLLRVNAAALAWIAADPGRRRLMSAKARLDALAADLRDSAIYADGMDTMLAARLARA